MSDIWCYRVGEDGMFSGDFATKQEAIDAAFDEVDLGECEVCYVGKVVQFVPSINPHWVIESIQENAYESGGEAADDYLDDITNEQCEELREELNKVLSAWIEKNYLYPRWASVDEIEDVTFR